MAGPADALFSDLVPGNQPPPEPTDAAGLFSDLVPKSSSPAPSQQQQPRPDSVPSLRPGTGGEPPPVTYEPIPKAGYYTGANRFGAKVYTDPASASSIISRAGMEGLVGGIQDIADVAHPFQDTQRPQLNPEDPLAKTLNTTMGQGWTDPKWWAAKLAEGTGRMAPGLAAATVAGPAGLAASAGAFGVVNMAQALAPAYQQARQQGLAPEAAAEQAWKVAGISGAFGVAMGLVPGATALGGLVKNQALSMLIRLGEQTFVAQPALGAAQQAATNVITGRPVGEGVPEAAVMTAGQGLLLAGPHIARTGYDVLTGQNAGPNPPTQAQLYEAVVKSGQNPTDFDALTAQPSEDGGHYVVAQKGQQRFVVAKLPPAVAESGAEIARPDAQLPAKPPSATDAALAAGRARAAGKGAAGMIQAVRPLPAIPPREEVPAVPGEQPAPEQPPQPPPTIEETHPAAVEPTTDAGKETAEPIPAVVKNLAKPPAEAVGEETAVPAPEAVEAPKPVETPPQPTRNAIAAIPLEERTTRATELGKKAFADGDKAVPESDPGLAGLLWGLDDEQAARVRDAWTNAWHGENLAQPAPTAKVPAHRPSDRNLSINEFLADRGVKDDTGELKAADLDKWHSGKRYPNGTVMGRLVRDNGLHPDMAREAAEEAGYLPPHSTLRDLYDAMSNDAGGRRVWPHGQAPEPAGEHDQGHQDDHRQMAADQLRADLESIGEPNAAGIPDDALHDRLEERLAQVGAKDVEGARRIIEEERAAADARLASHPDLGELLKTEDGKGDFDHEARSVSPDGTRSPAPAGDEARAGEGKELPAGGRPENPPPGDAAPSEAEQGHPGEGSLAEDIPFSRREGDEAVLSGPRHDVDALKGYLRERLNGYGLDKVGLTFAQKVLDGKADAKYDRKLIEIAMDRPGGEIRALDHEAVHALRDAGLFTAGEWKTLARAAQLAKDPATGRTIPDLVKAKGYAPGVAEEEAVAIYHSLWREGAYQPGGLIGRALRKIGSFFEAMHNWLRGEGVQSADQVLGVLGSGEMAIRSQLMRPPSERGAMTSAREPGVDQTPEGEQRVIPGAEKVTDRQLAERKMAQPKRATAQQKGLEGLGLFDPQKQGELFSRREPDERPADVFYSALTREVEGAKMEKAPAMSWKAFIRNAASRGVKQGEVDWSGVNDWLDQQKGPVNKADLLDHIGRNEVQVEDVLRGGEAPPQAVAAATKWVMALVKENPQEFSNSSTLARETVEKAGQGDSQSIGAMEGWGMPKELLQPFYDNVNAGAAKYRQWAHPGGERYRELLLTTPGEGLTVEASARLSELDQRIRDLTSAYTENRNRFVQVRDSAAPERAEVAALMREGDNIQRQLTKASEEKDRIREDKSGFVGQHWQEPNVLAHVRFDDRTDADGKKTLYMHEIQSDWHQQGREKGYREPDMPNPGNFPRGWETAGDAKGKVPNAPFKKTEEWAGLAMKRMIRWAAENGYDRIAWSTGEANADLFDISKQVDKVEWHPATEALTGYRGTRQVFNTDATREQLPGIIGKEHAAALLATKPRTGYHILTQELKLGGEGMRGFYDKILPSIAAKIGKKYGAEVGTTTINKGPEDQMAQQPYGTTPEGQQAHSMDITPAMRDSVLREGQPMWSRREDEEAGPVTIQAAHALAQRLQFQAGGFMDRLVRDMQIKVTPMAAGADEAHAIAKDFASGLRRARSQWATIDDILRKQFGRGRREIMGRGLDEQSVADQKGESLAGTGRGLEALTPEERQTVETLNAYGKDIWRRAQAVGMVKGEGLPHYMPRFLVAMSAEGKAKAIGRAAPGVSAMDPVGRNLTTTTSNLIHRKYLEPGETLAAARMKFGEDTALVTDIRALGIALGRLERAVAGRELMNGIKSMGTRAGVELVRDGATSGFFTLDHPAFQRYQPRLSRDQAGNWHVVKDENGREIFDKVPLYVSRTFEGPLRAVLDRGSGPVYNALMALKGKSMSVIMYSPLIHNAVEWGRALPLMPGKVLTFRAYFEGNALKKDRAAFGQAIQDGLVPIGHRGYETDIAGIENEPTLEPGRSLTAKGAGLAARPLGREAAQKVMRAVDAAGDFWHGTLLWDRVGDLQAGLYKNVRDDMIRKGVDPTSAGKVAAHLANRFAGAIPNEASSDIARKIGNLTLFSRSFTVGNFSVIKDMVRGLPKDIQAQIIRDSGTVANQMAVSAGRRAAIGAFMVDVALMYAGNSLLQDGIAYLRGRKDLDQIAQGYVDRFHALMQNAREDPLSVLNPFEDLHKLSATSENEPGKEDRVLVGYDANGTAIYLRSPLGKIGEEFTGWVTSPLDMLRKKESTIVRPILEALNNDLGFGRWLYDPNDQSVTGMVKAAGRIAWNFLANQVPSNTIQGVYDLVTGQGDQTVNAYKVLGPLAGLTFSKGAPGGPAVGELFAIRKAHDQAVTAAMPDINRQILKGDTQGAVDSMVKLGMTASEIRLRMRYALDPSARLSPSALRKVERYASPQDMQRLMQQDQQTP